MGISNTGGAEVLNKEFNGTNYSSSATLYLGFRNSGTELTGGGYARIAITVDTTNFPLTTTTLISNATPFSTPFATANWLEADEVAVYVASSGGSPRFADLLDAPFTLLTGQRRTFGVGAFRVRLLPVIS